MELHSEVSPEQYADVRNHGRVDGGGDKVPFCATAFGDVFWTSAAGHSVGFLDAMEDPDVGWEDGTRSK